ncbi:NHL repeat protein [compost metagenome]
MEAKFGGLGGLVRTRDGDLIVADAGYDCIRRVSASGRVTTIVGGGKYRKPGIGADEFDGFNESGYVDGDEMTAKFYVPLAIAIDSSEKNIYVCDNANDAIRKITFLR